ncbi:MAG TPA: hypothetical protein VI564_06225 [Candidatus Nanoarchaeia archaeon]|nr:hypothetical protein [Candidatus Nanoarchaeia archaeon]
MFWKKEQKNIETEKRLMQINLIVKKSFSNVKKDTSNLFEWVNFFYKKSLEQEDVIRQMKNELNYMPKTREEIRKIIDDYYSFEGIMAKLRDLNYRVEELSRVRVPQAQMQPVRAVQREIPVQPSEDLTTIKRRLERLEDKKYSIKEKIIKNITRNSKEYVKSMAISYIKKYGKISSLKLKEMVVDEQKFCSKSSFYRLMDEIAESGEIAVIKEGKEIHYIYKLSRSNQA